MKLDAPSRSDGHSHQSYPTVLDVRMADIDMDAIASDLPVHAIPSSTPAIIDTTAMQSVPIRTHEPWTQTTG